MKRPTILSSLFPTLGFHYYTLTELHSFFKHNSNVRLSPFRCEYAPKGPTKVADIEPNLLVPDALPPMQIPVKGGFKKVSTTLCYAEIRDNATDLTRDVGGANISPGSQNIVVLIHGDDQEPRRFVPPNNVDNMKDFCLQLFAQPEKNIILLLTINVAEKFCKTTLGESDSEANKRLCRRQEMVALELVTAYRHWVAKIQGIILTAIEEHRGTEDAAIRMKYLNSENRDFEIIPPGKNAGSPESLHSTREDVWRLICNFGVIEEAASCFFKQKPHLTLHSIQDLINSISSGHPHEGFHEFLQWTEKSYRISKNIAFKKFFEYFVYEEMPSSCSGSARITN